VVRQLVDACARVGPGKVFQGFQRLDEGLVWQVHVLVAGAQQHHRALGVCRERRLAGGSAMPNRQCCSPDEIGLRKDQVLALAVCRRGATFDRLDLHETCGQDDVEDNSIVSDATAVGGTAQVASVATQRLEFHFVKRGPNSSRVGFREPGEVF